MRQLNNKQFDTKEGASASLSELSHPQLAPSVSQKDEKMNQVQLKVQKTINNWFDLKNKEILKAIEIDSELEGLLKPYKNLIDSGVMVSYGENGCVAFDGEILDALRGWSEFGHCEKLANSLIEIFYNNDYDDFGFGVWNHCEYEGGK